MSSNTQQVQHFVHHLNIKLVTPIAKTDP